MSPQPSFEELEPFYHEDYSPYETEREPIDDLVEQASREGEFRHITIRPGIEILDLGCGGGDFLRVAAHLGARVVGVDPSPIAAQRARGQDVEVFCGTIEDYAAAHEGRRFDVVTGSHVIEHVPQPVETLRTMKRLLKPDGFIWLGLPNAGCWAYLRLRGRWHAAGLPWHIQQFTTTSIVRAGQRAGLTARRVDTESPAHATAASLRQWLRYRLLIPERLTERIRPLNRFVAAYVSKRLDQQVAGEAILAEFVADNQETNER